MRNRTRLTIAMTTALGLGAGAALVSTAASSAVVPDGTYDLAILKTPLKTTTTYGKTSFKIGIDGNWNSSFTFGALPTASSQGMTDTDAVVRGVYGSGTLDGYAGMIGGVTVSGSSLSFAGLDFTGTVNTGASEDGMTLTPTNRLGAVGGFTLENLNWNQTDVNCDTGGNCTTNGVTVWDTFTTGSATNGTGTINGTKLANGGDLDGDSVDDYIATIVSGGTVGSTWTGFVGAQYWEIWDVAFLSDASATGFSKDVIFGTAGGDFGEYVGVQVAPVPVPAAVWLFGSGLLGLVGVARRKKT